MKLVRKNIALDKGSISYLEGGTPSESLHSLLFLHGFYLSSQAYYRSLLRLTDQYHVIAPDLPGFGLTDYALPRSPKYRDFTNALLDFLAAIGVSDKVSLAGHSMGGGISIHFAATNPSRVHHLDLIDSAGLPLDFSIGSIGRKIKEFFLIQGFSTRFSVEYREMVRAAFMNARRLDPGTSLSILRMSLSEDLEPMASEIDVPTLISWGQKDLSIPLSHGRRLSKIIKSSQLLVFDALYHDWCALYPDKLYAALTDHTSTQVPRSQEGTLAYARVR